MPRAGTGDDIAGAIEAFARDLAAVGEGTEVVVATAPHDPRTAPLVKGPDLDAMLTEFDVDNVDYAAVSDDSINVVDLEKVKGLKVRDEILAGRSIDDDEVRRLVSQCDTSTMGLRNYALLALLFGGGLRRREVSKVRIADFDASHGEVRVRGKIGRAHV